MSFTESLCPLTSDPPFPLSTVLKSGHTCHSLNLYALSLLATLPLSTVLKSGHTCHSPNLYALSLLATLPLSFAFGQKLGRNVGGGEPFDGEQSLRSFLQAAATLKAASHEVGFQALQAQSLQVFSAGEVIQVHRVCALQTKHFSFQYGLAHVDQHQTKHWSFFV